MPAPGKKAPQLSLGCGAGEALLVTPGRGTGKSSAWQRQHLLLGPWPCSTQAGCCQAGAALWDRDRSPRLSPSSVRCPWCHLSPVCARSAPWWGDSTGQATRTGETRGQPTATDPQPGSCRGQGEGRGARRRAAQDPPFFPHNSHRNLHYGRGFIKIRKNNPTYKKKTKPAGETSPSSHPPTLPLLPWCREGTRGAWEGKGQAVFPRLPSPPGCWGQGGGHVAHHCWGAWMEQSPVNFSNRLSLATRLWNKSPTPRRGGGSPQMVRGAPLVCPPFSPPSTQAAFYKCSREQDGQSQQSQHCPSGKERSHLLTLPYTKHSPIPGSRDVSLR